MEKKSDLKHYCGGGIVKSRKVKGAWFCVKCGKTWPYYPSEEIEKTGKN